MYLFLERGEGREKERERNINVWLPLACPVLGTWPATHACALTGNPIGDPLVHRPVLNSLSHISQHFANSFKRQYSTVVKHMTFAVRPPVFKISTNIYLLFDIRQVNSSPPPTPILSFPNP